MKDGYIATKTGLEGFATMTSVPASSRPATCRTMSTARRSLGRPGCMAALDAQRYLEQLS